MVRARVRVAVRTMVSVMGTISASATIWAAAAACFASCTHPGLRGGMGLGSDVGGVGAPRNARPCKVYDARLGNVRCTTQG